MLHMLRLYTFVHPLLPDLQSLLCTHHDAAHVALVHVQSLLCTHHDAAHVALVHVGDVLHLADGLGLGETKREL